MGRVSADPGPGEHTADLVGGQRGGIKKIAAGRRALTTTGKYEVPTMADKRVSGNAGES